MAALPFSSLSLCYTTSVRHQGIVWKILQYKWIVGAFTLNQSLSLLLPSSFSHLFLDSSPPFIPVSQWDISAFTKPNLTVLKKTFFVGHCLESEYTDTETEVYTKHTHLQFVLCVRHVRHLCWAAAEADGNVRTKRKCPRIERLPKVKPKKLDRPLRVNLYFVSNQASFSLHLLANF